jgi:MFS family permease
MDKTTFIALSFVCRSIEAIGNACFLTASFSIIAKEFPDKVSTMFACLETCFGVGLIVGPSVGKI